jgi:hypothetical protein
MFMRLRIKSDASNNTSFENYISLFKIKSLFTWILSIKPLINHPNEIDCSQFNNSIKSNNRFPTNNNGV